MNFSRSLSIYIIIIIFNIQPVIAQNENYNDKLSINQLKEDLKILRLNLESSHPGLYAYNSKEEFNRFYKNISLQLDTPMSSLEFYRNLLPILPLIGNNHTKIKCPENYINAINNDLPRIPFRLYVEDEKLFLYKDYSNEKSIEVGSEILNINNTPSKEILNAMLSKISVDGYNKSFAYYAIGVVFSRYYAYYFGTPKKLNISFKQRDGKIKNASIKCIKASEINKRRISSLSRKKETDVEFKIESDIGYLKIKSFEPKKASKFKKDIKTFFTKIYSSNTKKLILDVRDNGGGFPEAAMEVLSYLINKPIFPYKDEFALVDEIPYPEYYEKDHFFKHFKKQSLVKTGNLYKIKNIDKIKIKPKKNNYTGKLIILLNAASASSTAEFLGLSKAYTNAIFIGEESGGNAVETTASDLLSLKLPNSKVRVTLPVLRSVLNVDFKNTGHGVIPDYPIKPDIEDLVNNRDIVMEFAIKKIRN